MTLKEITDHPAPYIATVLLCIIAAFLHLAWQMGRVPNPSTPIPIQLDVTLSPPPECVPPPPPLGIVLQRTVWCYNPMTLVGKEKKSADNCDLVGGAEKYLYIRRTLVP